MSNDTYNFQDLAAFHQAVRLVASSGLPIELGLNAGRDLDAAFVAIESRVKQYVESGGNLAELLERGDTLGTGGPLPQPYRDALLGWLKSGQGLASLEPAVADSVARGELRSAVGVSLVQPLIMAVIASGAIAYLLYFQLPGFEEIYKMQRLESGWIISLLSGLRAWLPVWLPLLLVGLGYLGFVVWRRLNRVSEASTQGGLGSLLLSARRADRLAWGLELQEEPEGAAAESSVALASHAETQTTAARSPLLGWAMDSSAPEERQGSLAFVASVYRSLASRYVGVVRQNFPAYLTGIVGGVLALLVGLGVFGPLIELLFVFAADSGI